jgi:hypothetical protein
LEQLGSLFLGKKEAVLSTGIHGGDGWEVREMVQQLMELGKPFIAREEEVCTGVHVGSASGRGSSVKHAANVVKTMHYLAKWIEETKDSNCTKGNLWR